MPIRPNLTTPPTPRGRTGRLRRCSAALGALAATGFLVVGAQTAVARPALSLGAVHTGQVAATTSTSEALAGTTLEADSRDDGTAVAPWLIWSGIAAGASVLVGGSLLKRHMT